MKIMIEGSTAEIVILAQELSKGGVDVAITDAKCSKSDKNTPKMDKNVPENDKNRPKTDKKSQKSDVKPETDTACPNKREWTDKQKRDIMAIKKAHRERRAIDKATKKCAAHGYRTDLDANVIAEMIDGGMKPKEVAAELGCCEQTVRTRYAIAKREAGK